MRRQAPIWLEQLLGIPTTAISKRFSQPLKSCFCACGYPFWGWFKGTPKKTTHSWGPLKKGHTQEGLGHRFPFLRRHAALFSPFLWEEGLKTPQPPQNPGPPPPSPEESRATELSQRLGAAPPICKYRGLPAGGGGVRWGGGSWGLPGGCWVPFKTPPVGVSCLTGSAPREVFLFVCLPFGCRVASPRGVA